MLRPLIILAICCGACSSSLAQSSAPPAWPREHAGLGESTWRLRGRIDADAIGAQQSPKNQADFGTLDDVVGLRRARVGIEGTFADRGSYIAEIDLATGNIVLRDVYAATDEVLGGQFRFGHFREQFSLEGGTSARFIPFMERSPANVFDPARNWGVGLYGTHPTEATSVLLGTFFGGSDQNDFRAGNGSTFGVTGKACYAPINEDHGRRLLHFGVALSERLPLDGTITVSQKPNSPLLDLTDVTNSPFVAKLLLPANFQHILNTQVAVTRGPVWLQAEWYGTLIQLSPSGSGSVFYHGSYLDTGWFLTGENRRYEADTGVLGSVRVNRPFITCGPASRGRQRGWGAWEVASRLAYLDLMDSNTPLGDNGQLQGIRQTQTTLGVNWYWTDNMRLMFNYTYALPTDPNLGTSSANIFGTRLAVSW